MGGRSRPVLMVFLPKEGAAKKAGILLGIAGLHASALASMGIVTSPPFEDGGEAPVINLTLEPAPRFDSVHQGASDAAVSANRQHRPPAMARESKPEIRFRTLQVPLAELQQPLPDFVPDLVSMTTGPSPTHSATPAPDQTGKDETVSRATANAEHSSQRGATQGGGGQHLGASAAPHNDAYHAVVLAWVERHKRLPSGRVTGIVTVNFVLDRTGMVQNIRLIHSSGMRALDLTAMNQIRDTQPFPRPQPGTAWRTRAFTVNIDYRQAASS